MNNRFSVMKRIAILCISFFISCCVNTLGLSEEMYAENNDYEYLTVPCGNDAPALVPSSIMRKFIYKSGRTQSAQGRKTCP